MAARTTGIIPIGANQDADRRVGQSPALAHGVEGGSKGADYASGQRGRQELEAPGSRGALGRRR